MHLSRNDTTTFVAQTLSPLLRLQIQCSCKCLTSLLLAIKTVENESYDTSPLTQSVEFNEQQNKIHQGLFHFKRSLIPRFAKGSLAMCFFLSSTIRVKSSCAETFKECRTSNLMDAGSTLILCDGSKRSNFPLVRSSAGWFSNLGTHRRQSEEFLFLNCSESSISRMVRGNFVEISFWTEKVLD